jgi:hypothetical protein
MLDMATSYTRVAEEDREHQKRMMDGEENHDHDYDYDYDARKKMTAMINGRSGPYSSTRRDEAPKDEEERKRTNRLAEAKKKQKGSEAIKEKRARGGVQNRNVSPARVGSVQNQFFSPDSGHDHPVHRVICNRVDSTVGAIAQWPDF